MRATQTSAEALLWNELRDRRLGGWKWRRQSPRGNFIPDFVCPAARLIVELDGGVHRIRDAYDDARTAKLTALGWRVLRFSNEEARLDLSGVLRTILAACQPPLTRSRHAPRTALVLSPRAGRGKG